MTNYITPGEILYVEGEIELNAGKAAINLEVTNTGDRAVQVGSHFHFFEVNAWLRFSRDLAFGMHLDIPSGSFVAFSRSSRWMQRVAFRKPAFEPL